MELNPYLAFNGTCKAAFEFYEKALLGQIEMMMTYGESPMSDHTPQEQRDRIMHVTLRVGNRILQGGDAPTQSFSKPQGFCVSYTVDSVDEAERVFQSLSEGATIQMVLQETFWTPRFGMLIDQFGIPWMVNTKAPASN